MEFAFKEGKKGELQKILETLEDKNPKDEVGWTTLHWAAALGHYEACQVYYHKLSPFHIISN